MIEFGPLSLVPAPSGAGPGQFRLVAPLTVRLGGDVIDTVPAGFVTDGASLPWWALWWGGAWGADGEPGVWHDWLCTQGQRPKWECDLLFLYGLRSCGVSELRAAIMYLAVRTRRLERSSAR